MTKNKDLKRRVRARMTKTGESYTAARANLVSKQGPDVSQYAELAGMTDDAVAKKTSKRWVEWVRALDAFGAAEMSHRDIAKQVGQRWPEIGSWWAQSVTVGYERIRGLREKGQLRTTKFFEANKSRTFKAPYSKLYKAFSTKRIRRRWLGELEPTITSSTDKSIRMTWPDGTAVNAYFTDKGAAKSSVAIQHGKLSSRADVERAKTEWAARFDALADALG